MTQETVQDTQDTAGSIEEQIVSGTSEANEMAFGSEEAIEHTAEDLVTGGQVDIGQNEDIQPQTPPKQPVQANNDETRFNYWQSEADKAKNVIASQERELEALRSLRDHVNTNPAPAQAEAPKEEEVQEVVFPDPPSRPEAPAGFSRDEAYQDPSSQSARHLAELDEWRDNMTQYNTLHSQFMLAKQQEAYDAKLDEVKKVEARREAREQQGRQMQQIDGYVQETYGLSAEEANEFINIYSDPNSVNIKNLVDLYKMQKTQQMGQPGNQSPAPSPQFEQRKRTQQIPSPMGVVSGQGGGNENRSDSDVVMDALVNDYNKRNPF